MKTTQLHEIYTPVPESVVVEVVRITKTKSGIVLDPATVTELEKKQSPALKVVAVGSDLKSKVKVGDWVMINRSAIISPINLIYTDPNGERTHFQLRDYDILGVVDKDFKVAMDEAKEPVDKSQVN